ncbi:hypothetical protein CERSUDRAFT_112382 [Gelatoporia subvermispora B]|uniref:Uncharacterized protein n=1 Tax=Ceriporiopsis subvermispora (strain B) TaxID=914234 RepID=M2RP01_CERS8|nr:hypothetical protein CERSUDRAFT_112382 [Gelatoporia subvermispora B]
MTWLLRIPASHSFPARASRSPTWRALPLPLNGTRVAKDAEQAREALAPRSRPRVQRGSSSLAPPTTNPRATGSCTFPRHVPAHALQWERPPSRAWPRQNWQRKSHCRGIPRLPPHEPITPAPRPVHAHIPTVPHAYALSDAASGPARRTGHMHTPRSQCPATGLPGRAICVSLEQRVLGQASRRSTEAAQLGRRTRVFYESLGRRIALHRA